MKAVAEKNGNVINEPKKDCKKCYGRGYTARDATTKQPIPCMCIFPPQTPAEKEKNKALYNKLRPISRSERRILQRNFKRYVKKHPKTEQNIEQEGIENAGE
jgi:hypothetical protein